MNKDFFQKDNFSELKLCVYRKKINSKANKRSAKYTKLKYLKKKLNILTYKITIELILKLSGLLINSSRKQCILPSNHNITIYICMNDTVCMKNLFNKT